MNARLADMVKEMCMHGAPAAPTQTKQQLSPDMMQTSEASSTLTT